MNSLNAIRINNILLYIIILSAYLFFSSQSEGEENKKSSEIIFAASTPGDSLMKSLLNIPQQVVVDFIRWNLVFDLGRKNEFALSINYGESKPNTREFKKNHPKISVKGNYTITYSKDLAGEIYILKSRDDIYNISLIKLNENLFHILTPEHNLMVGNGGWSYTLNRVNPVKETSGKLFSPSPVSIFADNTTTEVIFDGRTPCSEIALNNNIDVDDDCFKIKWRLVLYRNSKTLLPQKYILRGITKNQDEVQGNWALEKTTDGKASIIKLDPDLPEKSLSFLVGDENVLFFLVKGKDMYVGNSDYSYTLNKKK